MADGATPVAGAGHNNPPADPFGAIEAHIDDLYTEAKGWLDGQAIETQGQADAVDKLLDMIREAHKLADEARVKENEPFDLGKAAVQEKYAPLIADTKKVQGKTVKAIAACKAALLPWRKKLADEAAAKAETERLAAVEAARIAAEAVRNVDETNLEAVEAAEALVNEAMDASKAAAKAEKSATSGLGLTTYWKAILTDQKAAILHYMRDQPQAFVDLAQRLADTDVRGGKRTIPGFDVVKDHRV